MNTKTSWTNRWVRASGWKHLICKISAIVGIVCPALPLTAADKSAAALHTFTNKDGRTIQAAVASVTFKDVSVKRDDGQLFKMALNTLVPADLAYVRQWVVKDAQKWKGLFDISAAEYATDQVTTASESGGPTLPATQIQSGTVRASNGALMATNSSASKVTTTVTKSGYKVTLKSQVVMDLVNYRVDYVFFWDGQPLTSVDGHVELAPQLFIKGTMPYPAFAAGDTQVFKTELAPLEKQSEQVTYYLYNSNTQSNVSTGSKSDVLFERHLQAVWLRVYDDEGAMVQEWSSDPHFTASLNWDKYFPTAKIPAGLVTPSAAKAAVSTPPKGA